MSFLSTWMDPAWVGSPNLPPLEQMGPRGRARSSSFYASGLKGTRSPVRTRRAAGSKGESNRGETEVQRSDALANTILPRRTCATTNPKHTEEQGRWTRPETRIERTASQSQVGRSVPSVHCSWPCPTTSDAANANNQATSDFPRRSGSAFPTTKRFRRSSTCRRSMDGLSPRPSPPRRHATSFSRPCSPSTHPEETFPFAGASVRSLSTGACFAASTSMRIASADVALRGPNPDPFGFERAWISLWKGDRLRVRSETFEPETVPVPFLPPLYRSKKRAFRPFSRPLYRALFPSRSGVEMGGEKDEQRWVFGWWGMALARATSYRRASRLGSAPSWLLFASWPRQWRLPRALQWHPLLADEP